MTQNFKTTLHPKVLSYSHQGAIRAESTPSNIMFYDILQEDIVNKIVI